jgi:glycosyltransferase involved in cell wall biosynthesis
MAWPWIVQALPSQPGLENVTWPRISVITPSYNQGRFIEETIRSVLLQDYPNLEYIIIDGGSDDESIEVIRRYSPWLAYWSSEKDRGQSHAINKGVAHASGDIIGWLNSDDVLHPGALFAVASHFSSNKGCTFLAGFSEFRNISGDEIVWKVDKLPRSFAELFEYPMGSYLAQPSVFVRREVLKSVGPVNERLHYAMDLDLWLRIAEHHQIHVIPTTLSWMRMHDKSKTVRHNLNVYEEVETIIGSYQSHLSRSKYRSIIKRVRRGKALACLRTHEFSRRRMFAAVCGALKHDTSVAFTRDWIAVVLRLVLPLSLRRIIFVRA